MTRLLRAPRARLDALARPVLVAVAAVALVASSLLPLAGPTAARETTTEYARSSYLCTGYDGCARAGYGHAGYKERGGTMYWNMYSGHNCTNYVAYRMVQAGMPNVRPWSGSGNAMYWGTSNASKTDRTPEVGAVAWFRANRPGVSGSAGHVAYVERVVSPTEIVVSEDSWGGDFHWRRYSVGAGTWPDGFIHFVDSTPEMRSTARPTIKGTPRVGSRLGSTRGAFEPRVESARRQWLVGGAPVQGATAKSFVPRPRDVGEQVVLQVTGRRGGYEPATATSEPSAPVRRGLFATDRPTVSGEPTVGETLTVTPAAITPEPARRQLQWYADGDPIAGETGNRLVLGQELRGAAVSARVTSLAPGFKASERESRPTAPVGEAEVEVVEPATVSGTPRAGETLTADPGSFTPPQAEVRYRWLRDGEPVRGGRLATYDLRPRDVGAWMSVRVRMVRPGFASGEQVVEVEQPVRAVPELVAEPAGRARRAVVELRMTAPGVAEPAGEVVVRVAKQQVTATMEAGYVRVVVRDLRPGERLVRARFTGAELIEPTAVQAPVTVLP